MKPNTKGVKREALKIHTQFITKQEKILALDRLGTFVKKKLEFVFTVEAKNEEIWRH